MKQDQDNRMTEEGISKRELESIKKNQLYRGILFGLLFSLVIYGATFGASYLRNVRETKEREAAQEAAREESQSVVTNDSISKMQQVENIIHQNYYQKDIDREALYDGIFRGMMDSLGDPYSEYYSPAELTNVMNQTEGIYFGIGAVVGLDEKTTLPKISSLIAGAPAQMAGLRENDIIYGADGESLYGITLTEAVAKIKGPEGTTVTLTIYREGESDFLEIIVNRERVESPTVNYSMLDQDMGYIQITQFDEVTIDQFTDALATLKGSDMKGLILDLRSNPGGALTSVIAIARMILPEGLILYTESKTGERVEYTCDGTHQLDVPLTVLVNGNSASAAEVLAGAIKDYGIGMLVGTTTFGKGIVQNIIPLHDGSAIKLTVSTYFTPNGTNIHDIGITPDVECEFDSEAYYGENHIDNQLEKAKEVLHDLMKGDRT
jgi:carboxyl-terminal processing protease